MAVSEITREEQEALARLLYKHHDHLLSVVSGRFPTLDDGRVEDAVAGAYVAMAQRPEIFQSALESRGVKWMIGLATTIGCRDARDLMQRRYFQREVGVDLEMTDAQVFDDPAALLNLQDQLRDATEIAALLICPLHADRLVAALRDKVDGGEDDSTIASRHGVRREQVNRAWNQLRRSMLDEE